MHEPTLSAGRTSPRVRAFAHSSARDERRHSDRDLRTGAIVAVCGRETKRDSGVRGRHRRMQMWYWHDGVDGWGALWMTLGMAFVWLPLILLLAWALI